MKEERMGLFGGSLLWFGAAISIAEIFTGALLAPLGLSKGLVAILLGHVIGCALLYCVGLIGARSRMGAMESTSMTFGRYGSVFFSVLNLLQLLGWTAVMIISGAQAMNTSIGWANPQVWCIVIGFLIGIWILVGLKNISKLNVVAVGALFVLSVILGAVVFTGNAVQVSPLTMSFGLALELSIAMPVSWLPLISDYTKHAEKPRAFTLVSTLAYFVGSSFMYAIGLGAAIYIGHSDVVGILSASGLGVAALLIAVLSTVTTTYLDVYSAGESVLNILKKANSKVVGLLVCVIGTLMAMFVPIHQYEHFLYLIGSVFIPMATIMIVDRWMLKNEPSVSNVQIKNTLLWIIGFIAYRILLTKAPVIGSTLPVIALISVLSLIVGAVERLNKKVISSPSSRR